ncbi:hypothetical protein KK141_11420 [Dyella sp. LX-66]|uniref:hypothetical protein n=1 Tax=unclassified Dyella TaxID=2634549 RepID=UPI001BDFF069|nr:MULTISPECIES: hypothetical protein [unclassified Dyella]MBT2118867.1 hypothetical protein [Dyella sp. LX-1]MBT2140140.1 hypothetical protein [Dyella sp. LX-66]
MAAFLGFAASDQVPAAMPYADIFLVYDLLGAAIARGQLDVSHYDGKYTRPEILSCLCMLWRERLIEPPVVSFADGKDSLISFDHGASDCGRGMHRFLRETLLASKDFDEAALRVDGRPRLRHVQGVDRSGGRVVR